MAETLRSRLNRYPVIAVVLIIICVVAVVVSLKLNARPQETQPKSCYTVDDGATYFGMENAPASPFKHEGGTAVHANLFKGANGKVFVGYMDRFTDEAKAVMDKAGKNFELEGMAALTSPEQEIVKHGFLVKKPGEKKWTPSGSESYVLIMYAKSIKAPDGSTPTPADAPQ